jgi:hypothetical protein
MAMPATKCHKDNQHGDVSAVIAEAEYLSTADAVAKAKNDN